MTFTKNISELNGYLKALQLVSSPNRTRFGARYYQYNGNVVSFIENYSHGYQVERFDLIDYDQFKKNIYGYICSGMLRPDRFPNNKSLECYKFMLLENILDYYGFASAAADKKNEFYPILKEPVYRIFLKNKETSKHFIFLMKISEYIVVTYFIRKWNK